jgi:Lar family restriction alleviation protein
MNELKKCPFCGGEAEWATSHKHWIECKVCGVESVYSNNSEDCIKAWNNRKPAEEVVARLEELRMRAVENDCSIAEAGECFSYYCETCYMDRAIEIVKEGMG